MRKKGICFGLILALLLPFVFTTEVKASDNTELNIYAFYLNSEKKGDSTLLESKGHYLLIDIGADNHAPAIIKQLQTLGVTHVDVMFSHLHTDHTGGCSTDLQAGLKQFALSGITIDTLYLPDPSLAVLSRSYPSRYVFSLSSIASAKLIFPPTSSNASYFTIPYLFSVMPWIFFRSARFFFVSSFCLFSLSISLNR